jgi:hypothetical protein
LKLRDTALQQTYEVSNMHNDMEHARAAIKAMPRKGEKKYGKSRIDNGSALLLGVDGRNGWVRRCKSIISGHIDDLGGEANTSAAERSLIRRASVMTVELEKLEVKFATAEIISNAEVEFYMRAAENLSRLLHSVGITRRVKDIAELEEA